MAKDSTVRRSEALNYAKRLALSIAGVTGVDFGVSYKDGRRTSHTAIRFHVAVKRDPSEIQAAQLLPKKIHGFPVDVVQARYALHAQDRSAACTPVVPGISVGNVPRASTGTLGAIVKDLRSASDPCILSNWHVLCASVDCQVGEEISQPGPMDAGSDPARQVGSLARWARLDHGIDAAVASLSTSISANATPMGMLTAPPRAGQPELHMVVTKSGMSSGITTAIVDGLDGSYKIDYSEFGDQERFMDGIHLVPLPNAPGDDISLDGDSGAVWIDTASQSAVALHFAGESGDGPLASYAVAHPMPLVCSALNVSF